MIYINNVSKPSISTPAELKGWTVGAFAASTSAKIAKKDTDAAGGGAKTEEENNNETVLKKIANDRYGDKGAIIMNEDVFAYLSKKESITNLKKLFPAKSDDFGMYFSKKSVDQASIDKFVAALDQLKKSGELNKILTKHGFKHH